MNVEIPKDQFYFAAQYQKMSDSELLRLAAEGGFITEADAALHAELALRHLSAKDVRAMQHEMLQGKLQSQVGSNPYNRGTGLRFRGSKSLSESGKSRTIGIATRWIEVAYMPLIPIGSYKVMCSKRDGSTKVVGKVDLQWDQVCNGWGRALLVASCYVALIATIMLWERFKS
ncbi:hypothetical protein JAO29_11990 [Edaphobacter sp. HDX4]|uniref:hypothetical protein n=1 Tax=Edaphobacter sp. HDX4 TaxID=2794064 RepID=UPI002FE6AC6F